MFNSETNKTRTEKSHWTVPIFVAIIAGAFGIVGNFVNNQQSLFLEQKKQEGNLILSAIKADSKQAAANLIFLNETRLITLDSEQKLVLKKAAGENSLPSLPQGEPTTAARDNEIAGFNAILTGDLENARRRFEAAYNAYPTYHQVDEIYHQVLTQNLLKQYQSASSSGKQQLQHQIMQKIVDTYSWGMPEDLLTKMKSRLTS